MSKMWVERCTADRLFRTPEDIIAAVADSHDRKIARARARIHKPKQLTTGAGVDPVARLARKLEQFCQTCGGMREFIFHAKAVGCPRTKAGLKFANAGRIQEIDVGIRVVDRIGQISSGILTRVPHGADSQLTEIAITLRKIHIAPEAPD